jgi:galactose mutarotase-like enzyme
MIYTVENEFLKVAVSSLGAELQSVYNKKNSKEYLWQGDDAFWPRRSPVLFPIVGKLNNNSFQWKAKSYPLSQHGFARDNQFQLTEQKNDFLEFSLKYNEDLLKLYPFKFELKISYLLIERQMKVKYVVYNLDEQKIYFSIGGHPAFNCPLFPEDKLTDYYLEFEKKESADTLLLDAGLLNGKIMPVLMDSNTLALSEELFSIDTLLFQNLKSSFVTLRNKKNNYSLKFNFKEFPFLAIWKKKDAPFLCIEPWEGHGDEKGFAGDLKDKKGVVGLSSASVYSASYSIEIK